MTHEELKSLFESFANVTASKILAETTPVKDEISRNQAESEFGRRWLEYQIERGKARGVRRGDGRNSKIIFSRYQLILLKEAERSLATINK